MRADWRTLLPDMAANLLLPWWVYDACLPAWGERGALLWSALPPLLWSLWELYRYRRLDALSIVVLAGIGLSLLAAWGDSDARWLLVRESMVGGATGLAMLASVVWRKPLLAVLVAAAARRQPDSPAAALLASPTPRLTRLWRDLTVLWGGGLIGECGLRSWLAFHWPVARNVALGPWLSYGLLALLMLAGLLWGRRLARQPLTA